MKRIHIIFALLILGLCSASAADFQSIVAKAGSKPSTLAKGTQISGILVSDFHSRNMAPSVQIAWNSVSIRDTYVTAYIENEDASIGLKLVFDGLYDIRIPRFSSVVLDLGGCSVVKDPSNGACTVSGLTSQNVVSFSENANVPCKVKKIAELGASDIYTYVTVPDVEFLSKEGSYTNIREFHAQNTDINAFVNKPGANWFDQSGLYVKDNNGDALFLPVNTVCSWRRRGDRMPSGVGRISGIVVDELVRRCGRPDGLKLRIANPSDVSIPMDGNSSYNVIASWNWDRNYYCALKCESGEKQWLGRLRINYERVAPDQGNGWLGVTVPCKMGLETEYNTRCAQDGSKAGEGSRECAAIVYDSKSLDWFASSAAITVECSTVGFEGRALSLDFTWCAGNPAAKSNAYPVHWKVAYSLDGRNFIPVDKTFILNPIHWDSDGAVCYDASLGLTENTVTLPALLLGKEKVYLRILPADRTAASIPSNPEADFRTGRPDETSEFALRLGKVVVSALK